MKKEVFNKLKVELLYLLIIFIIIFIILKIAFYEDNVVVLLRTTLSIFWLFILPGYALMLYWQENLNFLERFVIGIVISAALIGISSYYIGLIGLNIKFHTILLPSALLLLGVIIAYKK